MDNGYGITRATPDGRWTFTRQSSSGGMTKAGARNMAARLNERNSWRRAYERAYKRARAARTGGQ